MADPIIRCYFLFKPSRIFSDKVVLLFAFIPSSLQLPSRLLISASLPLSLSYTLVSDSCDAELPKQNCVNKVNWRLYFNSLVFIYVLYCCENTNTTCCQRKLKFDLCWLENCLNSLLSWQVKMLIIWSLLNMNSQPSPVFHL